MEAAALPDPKTEPTISVERTADVLGISRGSAYDGVRRGEIPAVRIGRRLVVPTARLLDMLGIGAANAKSAEFSSAKARRERKASA